MGILFVGKLPESSPELLSAFSQMDFTSFSVCSDGEAALRWLNASVYQPELVVVEQTLPDMPGLDFCQQVRQQPGWRTLPLLLIAEPELEGLTGLVQAGELDYLAKGYHALELIARIRLAEGNALRIRELSGRDPLTRVSNLEAFQQVFDREWRRAIREQQYLTLLQLDLDGFEQVSQLHGQKVRDFCLKEIGELLSSYPLRPGDLIARSEAETFWVLLPNTTIEGGRAVAETLRRQIEQRQIVRGEVQLKLTASVGGASLYVHDDTQNRQLLFTGAEAALLAAKENGPNRVVLTDLTERMTEDER